MKRSIKHKEQSRFTKKSWLESISSENHWQMSKSKLYYFSHRVVDFRFT